MLMVRVRLGHVEWLNRVNQMHISVSTHSWQAPVLQLGPKCYDDIIAQRHRIELRDFEKKNHS